MKRLLHAVMLLSLVASIDMLANSSEFRSPRRVIRGVMHYPLAPVEDAWWYDTMPDTGEPEKCWQLETWGAAWRMLATKAFDPCADGSTSHTTSLSSLWFGKDTFRGEEIFAGNIVTDTTFFQRNPFLGFARISPRFDYNERGVVMGLYFRQSFGEDDCWHIGFRASLPVLEIEIEQDSGCTLEETLDDVVQRLPINLDADVDPNQVDYAYRLDFLSSLSSPASPTEGGAIINVPLVRFGDGTSAVPTTIGGVPVAGLTAAGTNGDTLNALPAAYVTRSNGTALAASIAAQCGDCDDVDCDSVCERNCRLNNDVDLTTGQFPDFPFRKRASDVSGQLAADGSGGADGDTLFFQLEGVNYSTNLALNRQAQGELFVVPRRLEAMDTIVNGAVTIDQRVQAILEFLNPSETAVAFFGAHGIDLCAHDSVVGVGDFYTEFSVGYGNYEDWYADFLLAVLWPTGTPEGNSNNVFHKPTGNNRHFEIKLGLEGGWLACDWFGLRLDAFYNHAFKAKECRAIPFDQRRMVTPPVTTNNCDDCCDQILFVKNIGQGFEVDISWDYFVGHIDFTFFHPYNPELGAVIGYELMAKGHDHVSLDDCDGRTTITATDLLGRENQPINLCILEQNTNTMTHKIYGDLFHRWNYFEIFGGASQIVGGKHAMQETEVHLGMKIFF